MTRRWWFGWSCALLVLGLGWTAPHCRAANPPQGRATPSATPGQAASDKEVVIRGESRLRVKVEKPEPDVKFDVDEIAVPYVKTEDYVMDISPTAGASAGVAVATYMNSSLTASPFIQVFKRPPIMTLRPRFKSKANIARWRLRITDGSGNVFRDFSGRGSLPEEIIWDGRSAKEEMADVGISYSYIFSIIDEASNPTSQMGRPVILESLLYEENGVKIAKILIDTLFQKKDRGTAISPKGERYLKEMSDILTARQSYPLTIESYAKDIDAANSNGEIIQDYLSARLILPKEKFKIVPYKSRLEKISFLIR